MASQAKKKLKCVLGTEAVLFPLLDNGNLSVDVVQSYFTNAVGLTYKENNDDVCSAVLIINREYIIENQNVPHTVIQKKKVQERQDDLSLMHASKRQAMNDIFEVLEVTPKKQKIAPVSKVPFCVKISWKHQSCFDKKPQAQNDVDSDVNLYLNNNEYDLDTVLAKAKSIFYKDTTKVQFDESTIKLGYISKNQKHEVINEFPNNDIKEFFKLKNKNGCRKKIYLFSYQNDPVEQPSNSEEIMALPQFNMNEYEKINDASISQIDSSTLTAPNVKNVVSKKIIVQADVHEHGDPPLILDDPPLILDDLRLNCDTFQINYSYLRRIKYSNKWKYINMPKCQLYSMLKMNKQLPVNSTYETFEPIVHGYPISQIYMNGDLLLNIVSEFGENEKAFTIRMPDSIDEQLYESLTHSLIYDCNALRGICHNGDEFGLGVVPLCGDTCHPTMKWFKNGVLFREGQSLFWITCDAKEHPWQHTWTCEVKCQNQNKKDVSSKSQGVLKNTNRMTNSLLITEEDSKKTNDKSIITLKSSTNICSLQSNKQEKPKNTSSSYISNSINQSHHNHNPIVIEDSYESLGSLKSQLSKKTLESKENTDVNVFKTPNVLPHGKFDFKLKFWDTNNSKVRLPLIEDKNLKANKHHLLLGEGGQGRVIRGRWNGTTPVAIKQIQFKSFNVEMLRREVKLLDFLHHPNIIQTLGFCLTEKKLNIVMELIDGLSLKDIIFERPSKRQHPFVDIIKKKAKVLNQICQGLSYMHGQKNPIIHGDIKPENIMVGKDWTVKLCDFGLSRVAYYVTTGVSITQPEIERRGAGTINYMSPEMLLDNEVSSIPSDIWALGCVINETYKEDYRTWTSISSQGLRALLRKQEQPDLKSVPHEIRSMVRHCFSYNPEDRPQCADFCYKYCAKKEDWSDNLTEVTDLK